MPGPVSDSYDPEYMTTSNKEEVHDAILAVRERMTEYIGSTELVNITELSIAYNEFVQEPDRKPVPLSEREMRIIRFCLNSILEDLR